MPRRKRSLKYWLSHQYTSTPVKRQTDNNKLETETTQEKEARLKRDQNMRTMTRDKTVFTLRDSGRHTYGSTRHHMRPWTDKTLTHRHTWTYGSARHRRRQRNDLTNRRTDKHTQRLTRLQMRGEGI